MESYKDKTVVITGGATGIGFSLGKQFGKDGANIVIGGPDQSKNESAIAELKGMGFDAAATVCDVTKRDQVEALADFAWSTYGKADVIVNNAGISKPPTPLLDVNLEDFREVLEVNLFGVVNGIQVFGKRFVEQGTPAAIYNVGSENSLFCAVPSAHAYISSKHSVLAITELLAEEMPDHIHVAVICPGFVKSEMTARLEGSMDTDEFTSLVMKELKAGERYVVTHAYNHVRMTERYDAISAVFAKYAPRYEGDDEYDVRTMIAKLLGSQE